MNWYENDVRGAITRRLLCKYKPETIFYGSSSFTLWSDLNEVFKEFQPVNLGFGGSTLAACVQFYDRIIAPLDTPSRVILYAGDNDLGDGAGPYHVLDQYIAFRTKLRKQFYDIPFYYVSIKPSLNRLGIIDKISHANRLIENEVRTGNENDYFINIFDKMIDHTGRPQRHLFEADGLHLNEQGYDIWKEAIMDELMLTGQLL